MAEKRCKGDKGRKMVNSACLRISSAVKMVDDRRIESLEIVEVT